MKSKHHECKHGLKPHGRAGQGNDPVQDGFDSPFQIGVVVNHPVLFATEEDKIDGSYD